MSYSSGNGSGSGSDDAETCTEVYISDILADSVAARDGRLRQGDQILQVSIGAATCLQQQQKSAMMLYHSSTTATQYSPFVWGDCQIDYKRPPITKTNRHHSD